MYLLLFSIHLVTVYQELLVIVGRLRVLVTLPQNQQCSSI
jgi:hypothetical protein